MFNDFFEAFSYNFMWFALGTGLSIGIACSFLGPFLVLKNYSLIGDGLSHVGFLALTIGAFFNNLSFYIIFPIILISSLIILEFSEKEEITGDSAIGMLSSLSLAIGVIIITLSSGFNMDVFNFLFGSILLSSKNDLILSIFISIIIVIGVSLIYNELLVVVYDEDFAITQNIKIKLLKRILAIFISLIITVGVKILGTLLISAFIIFPTLSAFQQKSGFRSIIFRGVFYSILSVILGISLSYFFNFPTGATIVLINGLIFVFTFIKKRYI